MESYRSNWQPNRQEPYFQVADTITSEWFRLASWMQVFSPSATKMETQACSNLTQRLGLIANLHVLTLQFHRRSWLSLALLWMAILLEYWIIFFFFFEPAKYFVPNLSIDRPPKPMDTDSRSHIELDILEMPHLGTWDYLSWNFGMRIWIVAQFNSKLLYLSNAISRQVILWFLSWHIAVWYPI